MKQVVTITQIMKEDEPGKYFLVYDDGSKSEVDLFSFGANLTEMSYKGSILVSRPNIYVLTYSLR